MSAKRTDTTFPILVSYAFLRDLPDHSLEEIFNQKKFEVLLDCGAFSALNAGFEIDLNEYMAFIRQWGKNLYGYIALDKLQDPVQTDRNLNIMLDKGFKPIPVHVFGDDEKRMDELFEYSDWVAFGGLRRPHRGQASPEYVKLKMEWAKGRRVHWLGYTKEEMLRALKPFSCDCSSWTRAERYGGADLYFGHGEWCIIKNFKDIKKKQLDSRIYVMCETMGVDPARLYDQKYWRKDHTLPPDEEFISFALSTYSWMKYILEFKRQFDIRIYMATMWIKHESRLITKCLDLLVPA